MNFHIPRVMGVVNVTPDSFSDGGVYNALPRVHQRILRMIREGASIIDVGGESTRPHSLHVSLQQEMERVKPIIDNIYKEKLFFRADFSIDTYKAEVAEYALTHGFIMVNDVTAFRGDPKMIDVLLRYMPYSVLMYSKDSTPRTTRKETIYRDVMLTIQSFLSDSVHTLVSKGFSKNKIIIDPGMGAFVSNNPSYSFEIIDRLSELKDVGCPILIGVSRKLFLRDHKNCDLISAMLSKKAINNGASIVRVHNVKLTSHYLHM